MSQMAHGHADRRRTPELRPIDQLVRDWNILLQGYRHVGPCYVYSPERAVGNLRRLEAAAGNRVRVLVAVKANPFPRLVEYLAAHQASFDVASEVEAALVRSTSRYNARRPYTSLVGPGKSSALLREALLSGIDQIVVESLAELVRLARVRKEARAPLPVVLLRVNPSSGAGEALEVMGGCPSQFGTDAAEIPSLISEAVKLDVDVAGYHFFLGSQIRSIDALESNLRVAVDSTIVFDSKASLNARVVNFGGGLGIPHSTADDVLDVERFGRSLQKSLRQLIQGKVDEGPLGQIEAGRFIVGDAGAYVCQVAEVKQSFNRTFVIVDSGITGFSRPTMGWGEPHPIWKLGSDLAPAGDNLCTVVGPTCLPGDILGTDVPLPEPREGDVLVVGNAGAYGYTMSLTNWGSLSPRVRETIV